MKWFFELLEEYAAIPDLPAVVSREGTFTYARLNNYEAERRQFEKAFSMDSVCWFLWRCLYSQVIYFEEPEPIDWNNELFARLGNKPGLILWSSGSTGKPKAALHDITVLVERFRNLEAKPKRLLAFLGFDHIGGINTLFHSLCSGGCLVVPEDRKPQTVIDAIEKHRVQVLPTTPTFLNMLILSGAHEGRDLSSLELITYGTEPMPESTLKAAVRVFPNVRFKQTYGLSEIGILSTQSRSNDSTWVKLGGEGYQVRVKDGLLEIKAKSSMLGYLNAPSPFTEDGWFMTGDAVEQDGEYFRILGRKSEMINVGGEKVYPAEIEGLLEQIPGVTSAVVKGEPNPITGQIIHAKIVISPGWPEGPMEMKMRIRKTLRGMGTPEYKVPHRIDIVDSVCGERFKKKRV